MLQFYYHLLRGCHRLLERGGEEEGRKGVALEKVKVSFLRQKAKSSAHTCVSFSFFARSLSFAASPIFVD